MKFSVSSSLLYKHLVALYGAVISNPLIPILENFLFEITNGTLKITASDLQTSIIAEMPLDIEGDISIAVPARIVLDTLKNLPDQPISFYIDEGAYTISIKSNTGQYKLAGENADDFPNIPDIAIDNSIYLPAEILKKAIQQTIIATSHDDLKPAINGVYMRFHEGAFTFAATDIHRLVQYIRTDIPAIEYPYFIMPRKSVSLLTGLLSSDKQEVQICLSDNDIHFKLNNIRLVSKLINEKYPDYENVIPKRNPNKLVINRMDLLTSLRRIIVYTNKITHQVKFTLTEHNLDILAEDFNFDNKANEQLSCEYIGEQGLEIGFDAKSLTELLNSLSSEEVSLHFSQPNKAVVIIPNQQEKGENILLLVMPITVQS